MSKKLTIEYIRKSFKDSGYELLTDLYVNNKQKLTYICSKGHRHSVGWYHWQEGVRCPECLPIENSKRFRLDFSIVKNSFDKDDYVLLTKKYLNAHQQLNYICPKGHRHSMTWNNWSKGYRCPSCGVLNISGLNHYNWKGGISCDPYCDAWADKEYKKSIKKRDNYTCQNPDCWGASQRLTIHHIDYNKKNCHPSNLITLCSSCNSRANFNRKYWVNIYKKVTIKRDSFIKEELW